MACGNACKLVLEYPQAEMDKISSSREKTMQLSLSEADHCTCAVNRNFSRNRDARQKEQFD